MKKLISLFGVLLFITSLIGCDNTSTPIEYIVNFESNGGSSVEDITLEEVELLNLPEDPSKIGYDFVGWYNDYNIRLTSNDDITIDSDTTLYARWTIKFYILSLQETDRVINQQEVYPGDIVFNNIIDYYYEGYTYSGWYLDPELTDEIDDSFLMPEGNLNIYTEIIPTGYLLRFYDENNEFIVERSLDEGVEITGLHKPYVPEITGMRFYGWENLTQFMPSEDVDVYAIYHYIDYKVKYYINSDFMIEDIYHYGDEIVLSDLCDNWYENIDITGLFSNTVMPDSDVKLYCYIAD